MSVSSSHSLSISTVLDYVCIIFREHSCYYKLLISMAPQHISHLLVCILPKSAMFASVLLSSVLTLVKKYHIVSKLRFI